MGIQLKHRRGGKRGEDGGKRKETEEEERDHDKTKLMKVFSLQLVSALKVVSIKM